MDPEISHDSAPETHLCSSRGFAALPEAGPIQAGPERKMERRPARGFRSGPVAAGLATVAILAATALPGPPKFTPAAPTAPVTISLASASIPSLANAGTLRLGGGLADFWLDEADSAANWLERSDGTASFSVRLVSSLDPETCLEGAVTLRGKRSVAALDDASRKLVTATVPQIEGVDPRLEAAEAAHETGRDTEVYTSLAGTLVGSGELEGAAVSLRNVPDTLIRRGSWSGAVAGDSVSLDDTVFARVLWLREAGACAMELEDHGRGTLGLQLSSSRGR